MEGARSLTDYLPFLLQGVEVTLALTFAAMLLVVPVAFALALARLSKWRIVRFCGGVVVETFRGTSALVQLFWVYYVLPLFGIDVPAFSAAVIVLGLNSGSYFSEIVRSALGSVLAGQREAAIALHVPRLYAFRRIVLPQALPVIIPGFGNTLIGMLKFTSLASLVTIQELLFRASLIRTSLGETGPVFTVTLIIYFSLALALSGAVRTLEKAAARWAGRDPGTKPGARSASPVPSWALFAR